MGGGGGRQTRGGAKREESLQACHRRSPTVLILCPPILDRVLFGGGPSGDFTASPQVPPPLANRCQHHPVGTTRPPPPVAHIVPPVPRKASDPSACPGPSPPTGLEYPRQIGERGVGRQRGSSSPLSCVSPSIFFVGAGPISPQFIHPRLLTPKLPP